MFEEIVTQYGSSEPIQSSNNSIMSDKSDKKIVISFPLLMRIMEWCHEDAKDDVELHKVMEKLIAFNDGINPLTIDVYDCLIDGVELSNTSELNDLVESIKLNGLLVPIVVRRKENDRYELLSGHRREKTI